MTPLDKQILSHAWAAYGFLIDGDFRKTNRELAAAIMNYYDLSAPQNESVFNTLMYYPEMTGSAL
jgi:hypothetical protein